MSPEMPEIPSRPLFVFSNSSICAAVKPFRPFQEGEHARIHISAIASHDEPLARREAHRRSTERP